MRIGEKMGIILGVVVFIIAGTILIFNTKLLLRSLKEIIRGLISGMGKIIFFTNTLYIGVFVGTAVYEYFLKNSENTKMMLCAIPVIISMALVYHFGNNINRPIAWTITHIIFIIADTVGIGKVVLNMLAHDMEITLSIKIFTYSACVLILLVLMHVERKSREAQR